MSVVRIESIAQQPLRQAQDSSDNAGSEPAADFERQLSFHVAASALTQPGIAQSLVLGLGGGPARVRVDGSGQRVGVRGEWPSKSSMQGPTELAVQELASRGEPVTTTGEQRLATPTRADVTTPREASLARADQSEGQRYGDRATVEPASERASSFALQTRSEAHASRAALPEPQPSEATGRNAPPPMAPGIPDVPRPQPRTETRSDVTGAKVVQLGGASPARSGAVHAPARVESAAWRSAPPPIPAPRSHQSRADAESVARQVSHGMAAVLSRGGGTVTLRLSPQALGAVRVRVEVHDGQVRAMFDVATDSARRLLIEGVESLKGALESRGLTVDRLEVAHRPGMAMLDPDRIERISNESASERRETENAASERRGAQERDTQERSPEESASERQGHREDARVGILADGSARRRSDDGLEAHGLRDVAVEPPGIWRAEASLDGKVVRLRLDAVA